jgi:hypothetical protein
LPEVVSDVVEQIERDRVLTRLDTSHLHEWLIAARLLPPRIRTTERGRYANSRS